MSIAHVDDIDIWYEVHGRDDAPWVLNIGGSGGDLRQTFPDRSPLNADFRVVHYDQRGLGRTSRPETDYSMEDYADDAAALIEQVAAGPCHVVGTSFGGMVALNLCARRPDLVDRMALIVTSPGGAHASYPLLDLESVDAAESFPLRMRLLDERWDPEADEPIPDLGAVYDVVVEGHHAVVPADVRDGRIRQLRARAGHDVVDRLPSIEQLTLVCAGRFDGIAPVANAEVIVDAMPDARLEIFAGGHLVMFQDRRLYAAVVDFLAG